MPENRFEQKIQPFTGGDGLRSCGVETIQANLGLRCNQQCRHCHLGASPHRTETMNGSTMERILQIAPALNCRQLDLTGGAPEMNPRFLPFVTAACEAGLAVQVRTNLTIHLEPGMESLAEHLRDLRVSLVASLPCYLAANVDAQRGANTHSKSIEVLRKLNGLGYGVEADLPLSLVYNPAGASLPPEQSALEADYRRELAERYGVRFTSLLTITNMPIGRFLADLQANGADRAYQQTLENAFNPATLDAVMCRRQVSVGFDGVLYDCDFNLALGAPLDHGAPKRLEDFDAEAVSERRIVTGDYCFGCTAGAGSSCGGALVEDN